MEGVALKGLTVDFHEPGFVARIGGENNQPFPFQMSDEERQQAGSPWGLANPQALNRYSYVQNNPLRSTDPTGHYIKGGTSGLGSETAVGYESACEKGGNLVACGKGAQEVKRCDANGANCRNLIRTWVEDEQGRHEKFVWDDPADSNDEFSQFQALADKAAEEWDNLLKVTGGSAAGI